QVDSQNCNLAAHRDTNLNVREHHPCRCRRVARGTPQLHQKDNRRQLETQEAVCNLFSRVCNRLQTQRLPCWICGPHLLVDQLGCLIIAGSPTVSHQILSLFSELSPVRHSCPNPSSSQTLLNHVINAYAKYGSQRHCARKLCQPASNHTVEPKMRFGPNCFKDFWLYCVLLDFVHRECSKVRHQAAGRPPQVAYAIGCVQSGTALRHSDHVAVSNLVESHAQFLLVMFNHVKQKSIPTRPHPCTPFPTHPFTLVIADRLSERKTRVTHFVGHCSNILREATTWCPGLVRSHLVHYLLDNQSVAEAIRGQHCGLSYAAEQILGAGRPNQETSELPRCISRDMSNCVAVLQLRARCLGAVDGMRSLTDLPQLQSLLTDQLLSSPDHNQLPVPPLRLIVHPDTPDKCVRPLLHDPVCWAGLRQFNSDVLDAAVSCWLWVITAKPHLSSLLSHRVLLRFSAERRIGLFAKSKADPTPLVFCEDYQLSQPVPGC
uniref:HAUS6_N domain-containing protein n=1 Tax=Macrostomum lignano TaxID=282301 RepID=A0A1I8FKW8_9PLAT